MSCVEKIVNGRILEGENCQCREFGCGKLAIGGPFWVAFWRGKIVIGSVFFAGEKYKWLCYVGKIVIG